MLLYVCVWVCVEALMYAEGIDVTVNMTETINFQHGLTVRHQKKYYGINSTVIDNDVRPIRSMQDFTLTKPTGSRIIPLEANFALHLNGVKLPQNGNVNGSMPVWVQGFPQYNPYYGHGLNITWYKINNTLWNVANFAIELADIPLSSICTGYCWW